MNLAKIQTGFLKFLATIVFASIVIIVVYFSLVGKPTSPFKFELTSFKNSSNGRVLVEAANYYTTPIKEFVMEKCQYEFYWAQKNHSNIIDKTELEFDEISDSLNQKSIHLLNGGVSESEMNSNCTTRGLKYKKIAFIIPYRNRLKNLKVFLNNMHPYWVRHNISYGVYLIEPLEELKFNRGLLMNIGFLESIRDGRTVSETHWDCFVFHDVDMIPEDDRVYYTCDPEYPVHFAVAVSKFNYDTTGYFAEYFGGINGFTKEQFESINGFSNLYFGWGGEDDDLYARAVYKFKKIVKIPSEIGRFYMDDHDQDTANPKRHAILAKEKENLLNDGILEGLSTLRYQVKAILKEQLFTKILVYYNRSEILDK